MGKPIIILGAKVLGKSALEILNNNEIIFMDFLMMTNLYTRNWRIISSGEYEDEKYLKSIGGKCEALSLLKILVKENYWLKC